MQSYIFFLEKGIFLQFLPQKSQFLPQKRTKNDPPSPTQLRLNSDSTPTQLRLKSDSTPTKEIERPFGGHVEFFFPMSKKRCIFAS